MFVCESVERKKGECDKWPCGQVHYPNDWSLSGEQRKVKQDNITQKICLYDYRRISSSLSNCRKPSLYARKERDFYIQQAFDNNYRITLFFSHLGRICKFFMFANSGYCFILEFFCMFNFLFIYTSILNILYKKREVFQICTRFI